MYSKEDYYRETYIKLVSIFPKKPWVEAFYRLNRYSKVQITVKQLADNIIAYGLNLWEKGMLSVHDEYQDSALAEAMFYGGKFLELYGSLIKEDQDRLRARFSAAFRRPTDMRAIIFEIFMFNVLKKDYVVQYKNETVAGQTYDYLITRESTEIQVECKSFAYDKGLLSTGEDAQDLAEMILIRELDFLESPIGEIGVLTIEMFESIPKSKKAIDQLANEIYSSLHGSHQPNNRFQLHIEHFNEIKNINEVDAALDLAVQKNGVELAFVVSIPDEEKSRICVRITTRANNSFLREFENVCKEAAKRQLGEDKASSIAIHISNIETLSEFLDDSRFATKKNNIFNQNHIVSLIIVSNISVYQENTYPFFYVSPKIIEFGNDRSKFGKIDKIL